MHKLYALVGNEAEVRAVFSMVALSFRLKCKEQANGCMSVYIRQLINVDYNILLHFLENCFSVCNLKFEALVGAANRI